MLNRKAVLGLLASILIPLAAEARASSLLTNESSESGTVCCFQATEIYGELFTAADNVLADFTFKLSSSAPDFSATFGIAKWDPIAGVIDGSPLYASTVSIGSGLDQWIGGSGLNVVLTSGATYVAFLLNLSSSGDSKATFGQALDGGPIGDGAGHTYLTLNALEWYPVYDYDFVYRAGFKSAVTPIPAALPLFVAALCSLGLVAWRRQTAAAEIRS